MARMRIACGVLCIAMLLDGCATGVGCLAGGLTGALGLPLLVAAESESGDRPNYAAAIVVGAALGAVTGCISGSFAAGRERTIQKRLLEAEEAKKCAEKPPVYVPVPYYPGQPPPQPMAPSRGQVVPPPDDEQVQ